MIPTRHNYINDFGQPIYMIDGAAHGSRTAADIELLVVHHTAGTDSRLYLRKNALQSSTTYLIGAYEDTGYKPRVYKYMSETFAAPYTQGFGSIAEDDTPLEINKAAIAIEVEGGVKQKDGTLFLEGVITESAILAASIIKYWRDRGIDLLLVGHKHIDERKQDPAFPWSAFCKEVYTRI
jgi:N-acetyl-anhydromuramyl-L-alanine amidase AmpD